MMTDALIHFLRHLAPCCVLCAEAVAFAKGFPAVLVGETLTEAAVRARLYEDLEGARGR